MTVLRHAHCKSQYATSEEHTVFDKRQLFVHSRSDSLLVLFSNTELL